MDTKLVITAVFVVFGSSATVFGQNSPEWICLTSAPMGQI